MFVLEPISSNLLPISSWQEIFSKLFLCQFAYLVFGAKLEDYSSQISCWYETFKEFYMVQSVQSDMVSSTFLAKICKPKLRVIWLNVDFLRVIWNIFYLNTRKYVHPRHRWHFCWQIPFLKQFKTLTVFKVYLKVHPAQITSWRLWLQCYVQSNPCWCVHICPFFV